MGSLYFAPSDTFNGGTMDDFRQACKLALDDISTKLNHGVKITEKIKSSTFEYRIPFAVLDDWKVDFGAKDYRGTYGANSKTAIKTPPITLFQLDQIANSYSLRIIPKEY